MAPVSRRDFLKIGGVGATAVAGSGLVTNWWGLDPDVVHDPATDGVTEWAGWSFANKAWWAETAEDQERSQRRDYSRTNDCGVRRYTAEREDRFMKTHLKQSIS